MLSEIPVKNEEQNIIDKLSALFSNQKSILNRYSEVLEKEKSALLEANMDKLSAYVRIRELLERKLKAIQKVIFPLEHFYKQKYREPDFPANNNSLNAIKTKIEALKTEIGAELAENRKIANKQLVFLKTEIQKIRINHPYKSVFKKNAMPAFIDISG